MKDIKVKEHIVSGIQKVNKGTTNIIKTRDKITLLKRNMNNVNSNNQEESVSEDGNRAVITTSLLLKNTIINSVNKIGKKSYIKTKENINSISMDKSSQADNNKKSVMKKLFNKLNNSAKKVLGRFEIFSPIKKTVSSTKILLRGTNLLLTGLIAGAWIVILIVIIICLIGLLFSSILGIFFSGSHSGTPVDTVVRQLNQELYNRIEEIKKENNCDEVEISGNRAEWIDVLTIFCAKTYSANKNSEVMTLTDSKITILKSIFWNMNIIETSIDSRPNATIENRDGEIKTLHIKITGKTTEDMIKEYHFTPMQKGQVEELSTPDKKDLWLNLIYGNSSGGTMVEIAQSQVGNKGGELYWRWYGFDSRVEWCAVFVSWVANQAGYINSGIIPKFSVCQTQGIPWFKTMNQWKFPPYQPSPGDIIFFDWQNDGKADHVGIVESVDANKVYTIEGNSRDEVKRKEYLLNNKVIIGYGTPTY